MLVSVNYLIEIIKSYIIGGGGGVTCLYLPWGREVILRKKYFKIINVFG